MFTIWSLVLEQTVQLRTFLLSINLTTISIGSWTAFWMFFSTFQFLLRRLENDNQCGKSWNEYKTPWAMKADSIAGLHKPRIDNLFSGTRNLCLTCSQNQFSFSASLINIYFVPKFMICIISIAFSVRKDTSTGELNKRKSSILIEYRKTLKS